MRPVFIIQTGVKPVIHVHLLPQEKTLTLHRDNSSGSKVADFKFNQILPFMDSDTLSLQITTKNGPNTSQNLKTLKSTFG